MTLDAYADRVCEILDGGEPAILVGNSMGGIVISQAAARQPDRVERLVYVAAFLPGDGQSLMDLTALPEGAGDRVQANVVVSGDPPVGVLPEATHRELNLGLLRRRSSTGRSSGWARRPWRRSPSRCRWAKSSSESPAPT